MSVSLKNVSQGLVFFLLFHLQELLGTVNAVHLPGMVSMKRWKLQ